MEGEGHEADEIAEGWGLGGHGGHSAWGTKYKEKGYTMSEWKILVGIDTQEIFYVGEMEMFNSNVEDSGDRNDALTLQISLGKVQATKLAS